jgi:hypothetical protein
MPLLLDLPAELLSHILTFLSSDPDKGNLSQTCTLLSAWLLPSLRSRRSHLTINSTNPDPAAAGLDIHHQLITYLSSILACPALRWLPHAATIGFVAYTEVKAYHAIETTSAALAHPDAPGQHLAATGPADGTEPTQRHRHERDDDRAIVLEASRRAGFTSRGAGDEDNLDFLAALVLMLCPRLERVRVDYANLTLCHALATVGGFRLVEDAAPGDMSTWRRRG